MEFFIKSFLSEIILLVGSLIITMHGIYFFIIKNYKTTKDKVYIENNVYKIWIYDFIILFLLASFVLFNNILLGSAYTNIENEYIYQNNFICFIKMIIYLMTIVFLLVLNQYSKFFKFIKNTPEIILLFAYSIIGLICLMSIKHIILLLLFIEIYTFCFYGLTSLGHRNKKSSESAIKYYLLGAISTGLMWLGAFYMTAFTSSVYKIDILKQTFVMNEDFLFNFGFILFLSGLLFKLNSVPFHNWVIDLYKGVDTIFVTIFNVFPKIPLIIIYMKIIQEFDKHITINWINDYILIIGLIGLILGVWITYQNQHSFKALMAGSSIANIGNILICFNFILTPTGIPVLFFYIISYIILTFTIFISVLNFGIIHNDNYEKDIQNDLNTEKYYIIDDLTKFNRLQTTTNKGPIWIFIFLFLILASLPPFTTFYMKYNLLNEMLLNHEIIWIILFISFNLISNYYYLKIVYNLLKTPKKSNLYSLISRNKISFWITFIIVIMSIIFITPWYLNDLSEILTFSNIF